MSRAKSRTRAPRAIQSYPSRNLYPLGSEFRTKLVYAEFSSMNTGALGAFNAQNYNLNSLFDPDQTFSGHQPKGFDELSAFFNRYRVDNCKVTFTCAGASSTLPAHVCVSQKNTSTGYGSFPDMLEAPGQTNCIVQHGGPSHTMVTNVQLHMLTGRSKAEYQADDRFQALTSASPAEVMIYTVGIGNPTGAAISTIQFTILMEFDCVFWDPHILNPSTKTVSTSNLLPPPSITELYRKVWEGDGKDKEKEETFTFVKVKA